MTLREYIVTQDCCVPGCDWGGGHPLPVGANLVPLCRGHAEECEELGREKFELAHGLDFSQLAAAFAEGWRQTRRIAAFCPVCGAKLGVFGCSMSAEHDDIAKVRAAQRDVADRYLA